MLNFSELCYWIRVYPLDVSVAVMLAILFGGRRLVYINQHVTTTSIVIQPDMFPILAVPHQGEGSGRVPVLTLWSNRQALGVESHHQRPRSPGQIALMVEVVGFAGPHSPVLCGLRERAASVGLRSQISLTTVDCD